MKLTTINVQIVRNLGNYESVRLGGEWSVEKEKAVDAFAAAEKELLAIADQLHPKAGAAPQKPQEQATEPQAVKKEKTAKTQPEVFPPKSSDDDTRSEVGFGSKELQQILDRIADKSANEMKGRVTMDTLNKFYRLSNHAVKVIEAAMQLNYN